MDKIKYVPFFKHKHRYKTIFRFRNFGIALKILLQRIGPWPWKQSFCGKKTAHLGDEFQEGRESFLPMEGFSKNASPSLPFDVLEDIAPEVKNNETG